MENIFNRKINVASFVIFPYKVSWEFEDIADQKSREKSAVAPSFIKVSNNVETHTSCKSESSNCQLGRNFIM